MSPSIEVSGEGYQVPRTGVALLYGCVAIIFIVFVTRFWYLQMLSGDKFTRLADSNRTRVEQVFASRGVIQDITGKMLAENRPAFGISIIPEDCFDLSATLTQISAWTNLPLEQIKAEFRPRMRPFEPQLLVSGLDFDKVAQIEQELYQWPGVSIEARQRRFYPKADLFAHILGYVSEANEKEMERDEALSMGDLVGKSGLEIQFEHMLRGKKGRNVVEVDAIGRQLVSTCELEPKAGTNLILSLDADLQKIASDALGEEVGSVVVLEAKTGKLRALVTTPAYDNNLFTARLSQEDWGALQNDPRFPLQNRTIQSVFPPGSVWKLVMVGLLLEQNISPSATIFCSGKVTLGRREFRCWRAGGHGQVDMMRALVQSCDCYFYEMSQKVGIDNIERYAKACGFGSPTGIDLPHEQGGLVPGRAWKRRKYNEPWQGGETLNVSIGQGSTLVTPLQMAVFTAALLNDGALLKPQLLEDSEPEVVNRLPMDKKHREFLLEAMHETAVSGTARRVNRSDAIMGGKTGTAQVVKIGAVRLKKHQMAYKHRDHAWITTWGIKDDKEYVVVVMVEHGGGGGSVAGPVAARVYTALFGPEGKNT